MKNRILRILPVCLLLVILSGAVLAQEILMEDVRLSYDFSDNDLVLSPQLARIYAPLLEAHGIDGETLSETLEEQHIAARAYNSDFSRWISVLTRSDELSEEIFDIDNVTDAQRRTIRARAENNTLWETTGYRTQDAEWQIIDGTYWLYIHYIRTTGDQMIGRGLRYMTIRNGMFIQLDWQRGTARFSNRDLASFRSQVSRLKVTGTIEAPIRYCRLDAVIPQETSVEEIHITGTATGNSTIVVEAPDGNNIPRTLSVGQASANGSFSVLVTLEKEGTYDLTVTAMKDGMIETSAYGSVAYSAKTLPVSLSVGESSVSTADKVVLTGETLAGVNMQLVTPLGMTKKRSGNDGRFSFELTTKDPGTYQYTLILDRSGYNQRRIMFSIERITTADQEKDSVRKSAERVAYKTLQRDPNGCMGKVLNLYGPVIAVSEGGGQSYIRMSYTKDASGKWYNDIVIVSEEAVGVKSGDMLSVVAEAAGVFEEQDSAGEPVNIPRLKLLFIDKVE